jgi:hypothetical protein
MQAAQLPAHLLGTDGQGARCFGRPGPPHDGFVRLAFLMNPPHPELTAEYAALYNFPDLFTEEELGIARKRLE